MFCVHSLAFLFGLLLVLRAVPGEGLPDALTIGRCRPDGSVPERHTVPVPWARGCADRRRRGAPVLRAPQPLLFWGGGGMGWTAPTLASQQAGSASARWVSCAHLPPGGRRVTGKSPVSVDQVSIPEKQVTFLVVLMAPWQGLWNVVLCVAVNKEVKGLVSRPPQTLLGLTSRCRPVGTQAPT